MSRVAYLAPAPSTQACADEDLDDDDYDYDDVMMTRRTIEKEPREWLRYSMRQSPTAAKEDVLLAHEKEYVERVLAQNSREKKRERLDSR